MALIVYYSSKSNNTHRFVEKLNLPKIRIPLAEGDKLKVNEDFVLITPTYSGGQKDADGHVLTAGAVPKDVIHFLNQVENRKHCLAVVSSGNTNFGDSYAIAGPIIANKLHVPLLHQFELLGTEYDVDKVKQAVLSIFKEQVNE